MLTMQIITRLDKRLRRAYKDKQDPILCYVDDEFKVYDDNIVNLMPNNITDEQIVFKRSMLREIIIMNKNLGRFLVTYLKRKGIATDNVNIRKLWIINYGKE